MGLIWNSPDTSAMVRQMNREFSKSFVKKWRGKRDNFGTGAAKKLLHEIANDESLFPDGGPDSDAGGRWIAWLQYLNTKNAGTAGEDLRAAIYDGLDKSTYEEIIFVVIPLSDQSRVVVSSVDITTANKKAKVITIQTPTWDAVYQYAKTARGKTAIRKFK